MPLRGELVIKIPPKMSFKEEVEERVLFHFSYRTSKRRTRACAVAADAIMASRDEYLFARRQPPIRRYLTRHSYSIQSEIEKPKLTRILMGNLHLTPSAICALPSHCSYYNMLFDILQSHAHIFHKGILRKTGLFHQICQFTRGLGLRFRRRWYIMPVTE